MYMHILFIKKKKKHAFYYFILVLGCLVFIYFFFLVTKDVFIFLFGSLSFLGSGRSVRQL